jgi:hypothetical protein
MPLLNQTRSTLINPKSDALRKHLQQQTNIYGPPRLVSLVNDNGHEKPVKEAYERYVAEVKVWDTLHLRTIAHRFPS